LKNLRSKTVVGVKWSVVGQLSKQVILLLGGIILARILSPEDFGLVAMVTVLTGYAGVFVDVGLSSALIQQKEVSDLEYESVFWVNLLLGFCITCLLILLSPLIVSFYDDERLKLITILLSFNFVVGASNIVHIVKLKRKLNFKKLILIENVSALISTILAIIFAIRGYKAYSIVIQMLSLNFLSFLLLWITSKWRIKFQFSFDALKKMISYSMYLLGTQSLGYWTRNADNLLIGKFLGEKDLGIYNNAYRIMLLPVTSISNSLSKVLFPSFSHLQDNIPAIKNAFLKASRLVAVITFPAMLTLMALSDVFVIGLLGLKWAAMIPVLQVLAIVGARQSVDALIGNLYLSTGRTDIQFKYGVFLRLGILLSFIIGLPFGIVGVAISYTIIGFIVGFINVKIAGGLVKLSYLEYIINFKNSLLLGLMVSLSVYFLKMILFRNIEPWMSLFGLSLISLVIYFILVRLFSIKEFYELVSILKHNR
jgi:PST family polysaccharide transporter